MRTKLIIVISAFLWLHCCLPAKSLEATKSVAVKSESDTDNKNANNTNYVAIPNAQTKILNGPELIKVQLQEAAEKDKNSKETDLSGNKTLSRKTTPTSTNPVTGNIQQENTSPQNDGKSQHTAAESINPKGKENAIFAEGGAIEIKAKAHDGNSTTLTEKEGSATKSVDVPKNNTENKIILGTQNNASESTKPAANSSIATNNAAIKPATSTTTTATPKPIPITTKSTTSTTTTTTTPKPKKPLVTYGLEDLSEAELNKAASAAAAAAQTVSKGPMPETAPIREYPNAEPSQEMSASYHSNRDYIVPVLTIMFTIPLAIGVLITAYRRFRDYWSTRHYRRMDFLVDGMYNE